MPPRGYGSKTLEEMHAPEAMNPNTRSMSLVQLACLGRDRDGACADGVRRFLGGSSSSPNSVLELHRFPKERIIGWKTLKHFPGITTRIALYKGEKEHVRKTYDHTTGSLPSPRKSTPKKKKFCTVIRSNPLGGNRRFGPRRFRLAGTVALKEIRIYCTRDTEEILIDTPRKNSLTKMQHVC
jgi:hypothetical protein